MAWQAFVDRLFLRDSLLAERYSPDVLAFETYYQAYGRQLIRLGELCTVTTGLAQAAARDFTRESDGVPVLRGQDVDRLLRWRFQADQLLRVRRGAVGPGMLCGDNTLVVAVGASIQGLLDPSLVSRLSEFVPVGPGLFVLHPKVGVPVAYLEAVLQASPVNTQLRYASAGAVQPRVTAQAMADTLVPDPSSELGRSILDRVYWLSHLPGPPEGSPAAGTARHGWPAVGVAARSPRPEARRGINLLVPTSPEDAVANALGITAQYAAPTLLPPSGAVALYVPVSREPGRAPSLIGRTATILSVGEAGDGPARRTLPLGTGLDLTRFLDGGTTLLNAVWGPSAPEGMRAEHWDPRELLAVLAETALDPSAGELTDAGASTLARASIPAFLDYADRAALSGRIELAMSGVPGEGGDRPDPEAVIRRIWDDDSSEEGYDGAREGMTHRELSAALLAAVPTAWAFHRLVVACFGPVVLTDVRSTEGQLAGALLVPLSFRSDLEADLAGFVGVLEDEVSRQMRRLLQVQQQVANEIVGRLSHIFRNRLGGIRADLGRLADYVRSRPWRGERVIDDETVAKLRRRGVAVGDCSVEGSIGQVQAHLRELSERIERMRQYYRGGERSVVDVDVNELLQNALSSWSSQRPDVSLDSKLDPIATVVRTVRQDLEEVFDNILSNSSRHMRADNAPPDGHRLVVVTRVEEKRVIVEIVNSGDSYVPPNATEPWVTTDPAHGSGLGLSVVKHNVEAAGGTFALDPNRPGPGVTNRLVLPNARWQAPHPETPDKPGEEGK